MRPILSYSIRPFVMGCVLAVSCFAADVQSPPSSKTEAIARLDMILKRIHDETLRTYQDTDVTGVERSGANGQRAEAMKVCVSPYSSLSCGCCGAGDVPSTFSNDDLACLAAIDEIESITIKRSQITDFGLRHLARLQQLRVLDLSENAITDEGLKHLAGLTNLESLILDNTKISGKGLGQLSKLAKLRSLSIKKTPLTGQGLANLPPLPALESFNASETQVDGSGMVAFRQTPNLRDLSLNDTLADDIGLSHLAGLSRLRSLWLCNTKISDEGLAHLGGLVELSHCGLGSPNLQGDGLLQLGTLRNLTTLDMSHNKKRPRYSKELIAVFAKMEKLRNPPEIDIDWPASLPQSQRIVDIHGLKAREIRLLCRGGAESIHFHDLPNLDRIVIANSSFREPSTPVKIGEIRIEGRESLDTLAIPMPERFVAPQLNAVHNLHLRGRLKADQVAALRGIQLKQGLRLEAFDGSEPASLAVFAHKMGNTMGRCRFLYLTLDVLKAAWMDQLETIHPFPEHLYVSAAAIDGADCLERLAKLKNLGQLNVQEKETLDRESLDAFRKSRPDVRVHITKSRRVPKMP